MKRSEEFAKDLDYESLLEAVNAHVEGFASDAPDVPQVPVLFVAGVPRSGTTLLYQALASTGAFAYPSNLAARFYRSPAFGVALERLLEPLVPRGSVGWDSRAGNTSDWWGPHEFGYFWQAHFPFDAHHEPPPPGAPDAPRLAALARELGRMEAVAGRPLLFKNGILSFVMAHLGAALPTMRVVHVRRDPHDVVASILAMRERFTGDREAWWSVRPQNADAVHGRSAEEQVVFQVRRALEAIESARQDDWVDVTYEGLCTDPHATVERIGDALGMVLSTSALPPQFVARRAPRDEAIEAAWAR